MQRDKSGSGKEEVVNLAPVLPAQHAAGRVTLIHPLPSIRLPDKGNRIVHKNGNRLGFQSSANNTGARQSCSGICQNTKLEPDKIH